MKGPEHCVHEQEHLPYVAALMPQFEFSPPYQVHSKYVATTFPLPCDANRRVPGQAASRRWRVLRGLGQDSHHLEGDCLTFLEDVPPTSGAHWRGDGG